MNTATCFDLEQLLSFGAGCRLQNVTIDADQLRLVVVTTQPSATCPDCATPATRIRGRYTRTLADLPWGVVTVSIQLHVRKFACAHPPCPRRVFTERVPAIVAPSARRTHRLTDRIRVVGNVAGGAAGAALLTRWGVPVSASTVLRVVRAGTLPAHPAPTVLGIDDWALRKGATYATLLVDLERGHPIDLLPDRSAASVATWLRHHPEVRVIARDRSSAYAEGIRQGAPQAIQVADRFHLFQNWGDMLAALLERHRSHLYTLLPPPTAVDERAPTVTRPRAPADLARRQRQRAERLERYATIRALYAKGMYMSDIARQLHLDWKTVRKYARAEVFPEKPMGTPRRGSILTPYQAYLTQRWQEGCHDGVRLWREIRAQGYPGSRGLVARYVAHLRRTSRAHQRQARLQYEQGLQPEPPLADRQPLSPRTVGALFLRHPVTCTAIQANVIRDLGTRHPEIAQAYMWTQRFTTLLRERPGGTAFDIWLREALSCSLREVRQLAQRLQQDRAAVRAACTLPWSTGPVEGHINRVKLIKRAMYGRAKFDLLRQRVLTTV